jgi:hypothetical protein
LSCCRLEGVKQLHIILLAISLCCAALFVFLLYRPYIKALRRDTKAVLNMLSQLPAEVDVEGQVKSIVLGIVKPDCGRSMDMGGPPGGPHNTQLQPYGMGPPGMMRAAWGMNNGDPGAGGHRGGWFGRRQSNGGPQGHACPGMNGFYQNEMYNGMGPPPGMQYGGDS